MNLVMEGLATIGGIILGSAAEAAPVAGEVAGEVAEAGASAVEVGALGASKMASRGSAELTEQAARSEAEAAEHTADAPVSEEPADTRSLGQKIKDWFTPNPGVESARDIGGKLVGADKNENALWTKAIADHTSLVDATENVKNWKPDDSKQLYQLLSDQLVVSPGRDMSMKLNALLNEPEKFLNTKDPIILSDIKNLQRLSKGNPEFKLDLLNKIGQAGKLDQIKEGPIEQLYYKSKPDILKASETKFSPNNKIKWNANHEYTDLPANFDEAIGNFRNSHIKSLYHGMLDAKNFTQAEKHQLFKGMYDFINTNNETNLAEGLAEEARIHNMTNAEVVKLFEPVQAKLEIMKKLKQAAAFGMDKQYADIQIPTPESTETEIYNFSQALNKLHPDNKALVENVLHPDVKAKMVTSVAPDVSEDAAIQMSNDAAFQATIKKIDRLYKGPERTAERRAVIDIYRKGGTNLADYNKKLDALLIKIPKQTVEGVTEGVPSSVINEGVDETTGNLTKPNITMKESSIQDAIIEAGGVTKADPNFTRLLSKINSIYNQTERPVELKRAVELFKKNDYKEYEEELDALIKKRASIVFKEKFIDDIPADELVPRKVEALKSSKAKAVEVVEELRASKAPAKQLTAAEQRLAKIKEESTLVKAFQRIETPELKSKMYESLPQDKKDILEVYMQPKGKEAEELIPSSKLSGELEEFGTPEIKKISPSINMDPQVSPSEAAAEEGILPTTDPLETLPEAGIDPASTTGIADAEGMVGEPVEGSGAGDFSDKKGFFTSDGFKAAMGGLFGGVTGGGIIAGLIEGVDKLKSGDFSSIKSAVDTVSKIGKTISALEKDYKKYLDIWNGAGANRAAGQAAKRGMEQTRNEMNRLKQEETKASGNLKRAVMKAEGDIKNAASAANKKAIADKEYKGKGTQDKVSSGLLKDTSMPSIKIYNNFQSPESFLKSEDDFSTITKKNVNSKNKTSENTEKADRKGKIVHEDGNDDSDQS